MDNLADIVLALAVMVILVMIIPTAVLKMIAYALVSIWVMVLVVGLGWVLYFRYKKTGAV